MLISLTLTSCGSGCLYFQNKHAVWAIDKYEAERKFASQKVSHVQCKYGIYEIRSDCAIYTFALYFYGYRLINNGQFVDFYQGHKLLQRIPKQTIHHYQFDLANETRLKIDVASKHTYVRLMIRNRVLKSATY